MMKRDFKIWFDELNSLVEYQYYTSRDELDELVVNLLIHAYLIGWEDVEDMLEYELAFDIPTEVIEKSVNRVTDGKTASERVREYLGQDDSLEEIQRVVTNECHRIYNEAAFDSANEIQSESGLVITKTWRTMKDNRVRDSHVYLDGMKARLGEKFYTWDGHESEYPGQFGIPDEDINCRCFIEYSLEGEYE